MSESGCPGCDGSGWYLPAYAAASGLWEARVNCPVCNDDWSKADWSGIDDDDDDDDDE